MADKTVVKIDPVITTILETREKHARMQKKDYSHVFRKKTSFDILRLTALGIGIGFASGNVQVFVSPALLKLGLDYTEMSMVWSLSPTMGLLLGPLIGSISDQCRLNFGRRRPVILLVSLGIIVGFFLLPFGRNIGQLLGDDPLEPIQLLRGNITERLTEAASIKALSPEYQPNLKYAVIFTILGTMLMDFSTETCQNPVRAYILDVCIPDDHGGALTTYSVMVGLGTTVGFASGGIDWESTGIGRLFGGNMQLAFMITALVFVICFFITIFSFREIPLPLIEKDKLLRPLTVNNLSEAPETINNSDEKIKSVTLAKYMKGIILMPKSMWILSLTNLLCLMGHICYCLYFTDFVGEAVFHGDPAAPVGSEKYNLYEAGVRFGGWGMALSTLASSGYALIVEKLMVLLKPKFVYIFGIMAYGVGMFILAAWPNKIGVLLLSITAGIMFGTINTVPFITVANYHAKSCFEVRKGENILLEQPRGLGTDIGIISSMLFVAQLLISLFIGYLVSWTGTTSAIFYAASVLSTFGAVSAMFVLHI